MASISYEASLNLALRTLKTDKNLSVRAAAKIYSVSHTTLLQRRSGRPARRDILANSHKLTELDEEVAVQYIIELGTRSFPPRLCGVEDMTNRLLHAAPTLASVGQSSVRVFLANTTTSGLNVNIQRSLASGLRSYGMLRSSTEYHTQPMKRFTKVRLLTTAPFGAKVQGTSLLITQTLDST